MSIRRRKWVTKGVQYRGWVVDYYDANRKRHIKTFGTKQEAQDWQAETRMGIKRGTHVAESVSVTVAEAGKLWLETCEKGSGTHEPLTRGSTDRNRQHVELHIKPFIGSTKLSRLTVSAVRAFEAQLVAGGRSPALARMVTTSLGSLIGDAIERDLAAINPVRDMRSQRRKRRNAIRTS